MIQSEGITPEVFVESARIAARQADTASEARKAMRGVLSHGYQQHMISIVQYANALHDLGKEIDRRFNKLGCPL